MSAVPAMKGSERAVSTAFCVILSDRFAHLLFTSCASMRRSYLFGCGLGSSAKFEATGADRGWGVGD